MDQDFEDQAIRQMLGTSSFGKQDAAANIRAQIELCRRKPLQVKEPKEQDNSDKKDSDDSDDDDDDEDDDSDDEDEFPISHDLDLKTHDRAITSITLDKSAGRLVTGSTDCNINFHDFASMTPTTLRAFKSVDPTATKDSTAAESHPINHIEFNPNYAAQLLVITAHPQAMIFSRDGDQLVKFVKGDMYLRDLNNTKGHTAEITSGCWNPTEWNLCATSSIDGTLRVWDVEHKRAQKDVIAFKSKLAGTAGRSRMTAVTWASQSQGGHNNLIATALDGTLVMYSGNGPYYRPAGEICNAHVADTWTSGISVSSDGRLIVTRGGDDTVKLWDIRKFKQPVSKASYASISSQYPTANIQFSPNSSNIIMGTGNGDLLVLNPATLRPEAETSVTPGSALITVSWNDKLNQILCGAANGAVHTLFNPEKSKGGALTILNKAPKKRHIDDDPNRTVDMAVGFSGEGIINPGGILESSKERARRKNQDPRRPVVPEVTPFSKSVPTDEHIQQNVPLAYMRDEDPREALLKYADKAKDDPVFTKAWTKTQPNTVYSEIQEDDEPEKKRVRR